MNSSTMDISITSISTEQNDALPQLSCATHIAFRRINRKLPVSDASLAREAMTSQRQRDIS